MNVVISKGVPHPHDLQNRIFYDLVMIMTWYLGWGDFRAWQTFSKFLVNRCWLNFDIWCLICQNRPKIAQKDNCWLKARGGCNILFTAMIFGWEVAQGVYNNLRKQLQSYLWSSGKYWHKRFGHFHQFWAILTKNVSNFSKNFITQKQLQWLYEVFTILHVNETSRSLM